MFTGRDSLSRSIQCAPMCINRIEGGSEYFRIGHRVDDSNFIGEEKKPYSTPPSSTPPHLRGVCLRDALLGSTKNIISMVKEAFITRLDTCAEIFYDYLITSPSDIVPFLRQEAHNSSVHNGGPW
ncbi:hypothetical protein DMENIID0001_002540 [Sergentomyia squamirostris]